MVRYSVNAARALGFLKRFYNDIDIYIEDITAHNMALFMLRNILGTDVKLTSVNQLGRRTEVIKACRLDQQDDGRKKLYIIDGDLDLVTGVAKPRLKYLYRLKAYCFENLIIANRAVVELAAETETNTRPHELDQRLDHPRWVAATTASLLSLFILYGVARRLCPMMSTTGFNVHRLCVQTANGPVLSGEKIRSRMRTLLRECIAQSSLQAVRAVRREVAARARKYRRADYVVSGKDYLLPLLRSRLGSQVNFKGSLDELRVRLARYYDPAREPFLARRLRGAVSR